MNLKSICVSLFSLFLTFYAPCMAVFLHNSTQHGHGSWTYQGAHGPKHWNTLEGSECNGTRQSPIDIDTSSVVNADFEPFLLNDYTLANAYMDLENNGHTVSVLLADDVSRYYKISGGGLPSTYVASRFHFHWGSVNCQGSEHTLNGRAFPGEVHMVHYNEKYDNLKEALVSNDSDAGAVIAFFIEVGPETNEAFDSFLSYFKNVSKSPGSLLGRGNLHSFSVRSVMPSDLTRFYRYSGSLTTPNCYQTVLWTVLDDVVKISQEQLNVLRNVTGNDVDGNGDLQHIADNFRPVNPLNDRTVYFYSPPNTMNSNGDCPPKTPTNEDDQNCDGDNLGAVMTVVVIVLACVLAVVFVWAFIVTVMFVTLRSKHNDLKSTSGNS